MTDLSIALDPASRSYLRRVARSSQSGVFRQRVLDLFDRQATVVAGRISRQFLSGQLLRRRTGSLARSVVGRGELVGGAPGFRVGVLTGPSLRYAPAQEYGTRGLEPDSPIPTIRPTGGRKALAIPEGKALTPAGVTRAEYASGPRPLGDKLAFIPVFRGRLVGLLVTRSSLQRAQQLAARQQGPGVRVDLGQLDVVFRLVRSVDLRGKHYLRRGVTEALPGLARQVGELALATLEGA